MARYKKFGELLSENELVLIGFYWDGTGDEYHQLMNDIAERLQEKCTVHSIDIQRNMELCEALRVKGAPNFFIYQNTHLMHRINDMMECSQLFEVIKDYFPTPSHSSP